MDRRTLFSMQAGLLIFLGTVVLSAFHRQRRQRNDRGGFWFGTGYLCAGVGLWLQAERGLIAPVFSILLGNCLFMLFGAFANRAVAETTRQPRSDFYPLLVLNALTVASYAWFTYVRPDVLVRSIEAIFVVGTMHIAIIVRCLRAKDKVIEPALRALALVLGAHTAFSFVRLTALLRLRQADAWFSWIGIVTVAGCALAYLWSDSLRLQDDLERNAMTDPLTGLFNRRGLDMLAGRALAQAARASAPCSALMLDLDHFKNVNDTLGHAAGDACLSAVARVLREQLRSADIATRLGGDEFFVLLPEMDESELADVVERLTQSFEAVRVDAGEHGMFTPGVSIGQVTLHNMHASLADFLHASDLVLYRQKQLRVPEAQTGRNTASRLEAAARLSHA